MRRRSVVILVTAALAIGGFIGCSAGALTDRVDEAVVNGLDTAYPGGLEAVCSMYQQAGGSKEGMRELLDAQLGDQDPSDLLGLPVHVNRDKVLQLIVDHVDTACG